MLAAMQTNTIDAALQIEPLITKGAADNIHVKFGDATDFAPKANCHGPGFSAVCYR